MLPELAGSCPRRWNWWIWAPTRWPWSTSLDPGTPCLVMDAARMGREPGAVVAFRPEEVKLRISGDGLSLHGLGLAEALGLADRLGRMPRDLKVIGVEPAQVGLGTGLSDAAAAAVPRVVGLIQAEVARHE
ncbi:MAG: hydrogenase maturation protease [bacterium]|nr:hydrogenase maturation protease [bacterium]